MDTDDPILAKVALYQKDASALARWLRSVRSMVSSASFKALVEAAGGLYPAEQWLHRTVAALPLEERDIIRINAFRTDPISHIKKKTTVSLDPELWAALIERTGSEKEALRWVRDLSPSISTTGGSFSRALQAAIIRFVTHQPTKSIEATEPMDDLEFAFGPGPHRPPS